MAYRLVNETQGKSGASRRKRQRRDLRRRVTRKGIAVLPTMFTLGNLLCGCAAIFVASRSTEVALPFAWTPLTLAAVLIFLGMLCDGLDGRIARLTRSTSDLGEQLDSMADMVTFGVAPAFLAIQLVQVGTPFFANDPESPGDQLFDRVTIVIGGIYAACAALRLARFNIEADQPEETDHGSFKGLPSPGAAGTVASLVLLHEYFLAEYPDTNRLRLAAAMGMVAITLLAALTMVSKFRYIHVMNRYIRHRAPFETVVKAVVLLLLLAVHPQGAAAAVFVLYALSAPAVSLYRRIVRVPSGPPEEPFDKEGASSGRHAD